uniref:Uncharacterized protein n=1 Tax=Rhizophora mucronata TaxID=61149 RepID=A0A2P2PCU6_RHIMU
MVSDMPSLGQTLIVMAYILLRSIYATIQKFVISYYLSVHMP